MTDPVTPHRSAFSLPTALSLSLPFGAYALIPGINLPLGGLLLLVMALYSLLLWRTERLLRPPFEYWWPALALIVLFAATSVTGGHQNALYGVRLVIAFLLPVTLAANGTVTCRAITAFGVASGVAALLHVASHMALIPPTVVHLPTDLLLAGPDSLSSGLALYACGVVANGIALLHPRFSPMQRRTGGVGLLLMAVWLPLLLPRVPALLATWNPYPYPDLPAAWLIAIILGIWVVARCAARTLLLAHERADFRQCVAPAALVLLTVLHLGFATRPPVATAFLLGLSATLDTPWTRFESTRPRRLLWLLPALCIGAQVLGLTALHPADLRNQSTRCEAFLEDAQWNKLDGTLTALLSRQPDAPDLTLIQARARLARGWPHAAVQAYTTIPPLTGEENPFHTRNRRAFRDALRDFASAQAPGNAPFYFEQALAHDGDLDQVYHLLEIRRGRTTAIGLWNDNTDTLCDAIATLLGAPNFRERLADWDAQALAGLLADGNVAFMRLPEELAALTPPLLAMGSCWPGGGRDATVFPLIAGTQRVGLDTLPSAAVGVTAAWQPPRQSNDTEWQIDFFRGDTPVLSQLITPEIGPLAVRNVPAVQREFVARALYLP